MDIDLTAVIVRDYDEAIAFFVEALGFDLVEDSPSLTNDGRPKRWVVVRPPQREGGDHPGAGLLLAEADGDEQRRAIGRQWAGRVGLFLHVDDFDAQHARMLDHDVEFLEEPRDEPYGRVAVFVDVCGNRWDLVGPRPAGADPA
ncbi:MAG: VOC family protein [Actinomycetota bacterium]